jgi:hypothetical protein
MMRQAGATRTIEVASLLACRKVRTCDPGAVQPPGDGSGTVARSLDLDQQRAAGIGSASSRTRGLHDGRWPRGESGRQWCDFRESAASTAAGVNDARSMRHRAPRMSLPSRSQSMHTHCVRFMPIARAAPRVRSSVTPRVNGPRSLITTVTDLPFSGFVTVTFDPKGSERCAAVSAPESKA